MSNYDHLRAALMREPRGHRGMFGAVSVRRPGRRWTSVSSGSTTTARYLNMCGHGTIGIGMTAVECGLVPVSEPVTHINVDMPAGLVEIAVTVEDGVARDAAFVNVPAFL